jgi:integrase
VKQLAKARKSEAFLFLGASTTARGERTNPIRNSLNDRVTALKLKADGRKLSAYRLRHTFANRLHRAGVAQEVTADLMGHARKSMTDRYEGRMDEARLAEAVDRLDATPVLALLERVERELLTA